MSSLVRIWIGCETANATSGTAASTAAAISSTERLLREPRPPLAARLERDVDVALLDAHRVGGDLGSAGARRRRARPPGSSSSARCDALVRRDGLGQGDAGQAPRFEEQVALVELRDELGAEPGEQTRRPAPAATRPIARA